MSKNKKKSKGAIPKKIAGVKVPKRARKGRFAALLASREGQAMIAKAIVGAGALAAGVKAKNSPKVRKGLHDAKTTVAHGAEAATGKTATATVALAFALGEAARSFADALRHGEGNSGRDAPRSDAEPAWTPDYGAPETPGRPAN